MLGQLIEDMIKDNSNNIRIVPESERLANFVREPKPARGAKHKRDNEAQEKREAAFRSVYWLTDGLTDWLADWLAD